MSEQQTMCDVCAELGGGCVDECICGAACCCECDCEIE